MPENSNEGTPFVVVHEDTFTSPADTYCCGKLPGSSLALAPWRLLKPEVQEAWHKAADAVGTCLAASALT